MIGTRLGQYEIVEELGKGGMATVYRAYHPVTRRFVAIKVIHQAMVTDEAVLERFRQEAELIAQLEHPYLLPVYDYSVASDIPYIVMRYLEGSTLKDVIDANIRLPLSEIVFLMRQITSVVDYAHRKGVIHRDIKPSNIMIDHDGNAYLTDFGIARIIDQKGLTQTGFTVGTPGYMSPEQLRGEKLDERSDLFSVGVMIYEAIKGEKPFRGKTYQQLVSSINEELKFHENGDLGEFFARALARVREERFSTADEMKEALIVLK